MTKLSPLILAFIVALGFITAVALALPSAVTLRDQTFPKDNYWTNGSAKASTPDYRTKGDPISDPIPNVK